jgi:hypothetical protein
LRECPPRGQWVRKVRYRPWFEPVSLKEGEREVMKRIRLLVLLGMVAVALPLGLLQGIAKATGNSGTGSSVSINQYADYEFAGAILDVGLQVACTGGSGAVDVTVTQEPPETPYPEAAGSGPQFVVCDGRSHSVGVTLGPGIFDAGKANATATLVAPSGDVTTVKRQILIRVV